MPEDSIIICRCSDLTVQDIQKYINEGISTVGEIKRLSRAGMGPCQGRTCEPLIMREIANITRRDIRDIEPGTQRPPVKAITLGEVVDALEKEREEK